MGKTATIERIIFRVDYILNDRLMPSTSMLTDTSNNRIPINLSIAIKALTPSLRPNFSDEINITPAIPHATVSANTHSCHRLGSYAIIKITAAIADGPANNGTAKGTIKGSVSSLWA